MDRIALSGELAADASLIPGQSQCALGETHEDPIQMVRRQQMAAVLRNAEDIARAELVRRRKRLGTLTREQEIGVEDLLVSTATKLAKMVQDFWPTVS
jgi:hypothetical protein